MIVREAQGKYPFHFWIEKAVVSDGAGKMIIEGVASTGNVDHDGERMAAEALKAMVEVVNATGVPLRIEHSQKDSAVIGEVFEGWLDDRGAFHIKAELDPEHVASPLLYRAIKNGENYGLSVGGFVKRAVEEMVEGVGRAVKTFYDIVLDEVSVTKHPSNYDAVNLKAVSKSRASSDYMEAFAKSIPANEWKRVNDYQLADKSMKTKAQDTETTETTKAASETTEETTKAASSETEETTKAVTRQEFGELVKMVSEGFNSLTTVLSKAISVDAKVRQQPSEDMETPEGQKRTVGKTGNEAVDQRNPDKKKEDPQDTQEAAVKAQSDETEETTKTAENGTDTDGERETKAGKDDSTDTYDMATVTRAIKRIQAVAKEMDEETHSTKAADDTETEETTKASTDTEETTKASKETDETVTKSVRGSEIDAFAATVADTIERMEKSLKKNGFQTEHIAKAVIENIRNNPAYQEDIKSMLKQPGQKRSVIMGTPFVKTRDGRMYKLTIENHPQSKVEKSTDGKALSFKEMWGNGFASVSNEE